MESSISDTFTAGIPNHTTPTHDTRHYTSTISYVGHSMCSCCHAVRELFRSSRVARVSSRCSRNFSRNCGGCLRAAAFRDRLHAIVTTLSDGFRQSSREPRFRLILLITSWCLIFAIGLHWSKAGTSTKAYDGTNKRSVVEGPYNTSDGGNGAVACG